MGLIESVFTMKWRHREWLQPPVETADCLSCLYSILASDARTMRSAKKFSPRTEMGVARGIYVVGLES